MYSKYNDTPQSKECKEMVYYIRKKLGNCENTLIEKYQKENPKSRLNDLMGTGGFKSELPSTLTQDELIEIIEDIKEKYPNLDQEIGTVNQSKDALNIISTVLTLIQNQEMSAVFSLDGVSYGQAIRRFYNFLCTNRTSPSYRNKMARLWNKENRLWNTEKATLLNICELLQNELKLIKIPQSVCNSDAVSIVNKKVASTPKDKSGWMTKVLALAMLPALAGNSQTVSQLKTPVQMTQIDNDHTYAPVHYTNKTRWPGNNLMPDTQTLSGSLPENNTTSNSKEKENGTDKSKNKKYNKDNGHETPFFWEKNLEYEHNL
jgi:hypothetical protein